MSLPKLSLHTSNILENIENKDSLFEFILSSLKNPSLSLSTVYMLDPSCASIITGIEIEEVSIDHLGTIEEFLTKCEKYLDLDDKVSDTEIFLCLIDNVDFFSEEEKKIIKDIFNGKTVEENKTVKAPIGNGKVIPNSETLGMFEPNKILDEFAENLNVSARDGKIPNVIDVDGKIDEISTILCKQRKPNALLVGLAGVGKSSIVEGIAKAIVESECQLLLEGHVIFNVSLSSMVAGTKFRGQFEERLERFVNEAKKYRNVILFIDEIHTLMGAGGSSQDSLEAANILKPELARGTISCIGATTIDEYRRTIEKDSALDRRFERVFIREPSRFAMNQILPHVVTSFEKFHGVEYSDEFLINVLPYCDKYLSHKTYPDKLMDVLDQCGSKAKIKHWSLSSNLLTRRKEIIDSIGEEPDIEDFDRVEKEMRELYEKWAEESFSEKAEVSLSELMEAFSKSASIFSRSDFCKNLLSNLAEENKNHKKAILQLSEKIQDEDLVPSFSAMRPKTFALSGEKHSGKSYLMSAIASAFEQEGVDIIRINGEHSMSIDDFCKKVSLCQNPLVLIDNFDSLNYEASKFFDEVFTSGVVDIRSSRVSFSNCSFVVSTVKKNAGQSLGFSIKKEEEEEENPKFLAVIQMKKPTKKQVIDLMEDSLLSTLFDLDQKKIKVEFSRENIEEIVDKHPKDLHNISKMIRLMNKQIIEEAKKHEKANTAAKVGESDGSE